MLSRGCWREKCTRRFVREDAVPWHPFIGNVSWEKMFGMDTLNCTGVPSLSQPPPPPPPPLGVGGGVGWTCCYQLRVAAANGPQETRLQGQIRSQGNVPSSGVSTYMRVPVPSLAECRPPLTMRGVCDMARRPCSPSFSSWYRDSLGLRGLPGRQTLPEYGLSLAMRRVFHRSRKVLIGSGWMFSGPPIRRPPREPPLLSHNVG